MRLAGLSRNHGLRHAYALDRYWSVSRASPDNLARRLEERRRASEVGAKRRTSRLTARARVRRWSASTDVCLFRAGRLGIAATRAKRAVWSVWSSFERAVTSGRQRSDIAVVPLMDVSAGPFGAKRPEGASVSDRYPKGRHRSRARSP